MATSADEHKEAGNKAFSAKNYDGAIECYTNAIKADQSNHVFFSNRSASYAGKRNWDESISDAKECIKLNPSFIKGYYRLASAQIEKNELDLASSSIKQGLNIEPENSQLHKLMRSVKLKKQVIRAAEKDAAAKAAQKAASGAGGGSGGLMRGGAGGVDSALQKEIMDLQKQFRTTHRDYSTVSADILKAQKTQRVNQITIQELDNITTESETKMYMGVGKMFMAATRDHVHVSLEEEIKDNGKKETELKQKKEYLERRMKSQQQNIIELSNNAAA